MDRRRPVCTVNGCISFARRKGGQCFRHGGATRCITPGCINAAVVSRMCKKCGWPKCSFTEKNGKQCCSYVWKPSLLTCYKHTPDQRMKQNHYARVRFSWLKNKHFERKIKAQPDLQPSPPPAQSDAALSDIVSDFDFGNISCMADEMHAIDAKSEPKELVQFINSIFASK